MEEVKVSKRSAFVFGVVVLLRTLFERFRQRPFIEILRVGVVRAHVGDHIYVAVTLNGRPAAYQWAIRNPAVTPEIASTVMLLRLIISLRLGDLGEDLVRELAFRQAKYPLLEEASSAMPSSVSIR